MPFEHSFDLLNIFEIETDDGQRSFVCFLLPEAAETNGIPDRAIVGEFDPREDGEFDPDSFRGNTLFLDAFIDFMNEKTIHSDELLDQARQNAGNVLYLVDPRHPDPTVEPEAGDILGGFEIDDSGLPVPDSFRYNPQHVLFDSETGPSGILTDKQFYDWMHDSKND